MRLLKLAIVFCWLVVTFKAISSNFKQTFGGCYGKGSGEANQNGDT